MTPALGVAIIGWVPVDEAAERAEYERCMLGGGARETTAGLKG